MLITVTKLPIEGLYIIHPRVFNDARGYFLETYNERDFYEAGLTMKFVQDNQSFSRRGVLRGLHFQKKYPQGKLVRVIQGEVYDVAVDIRPSSKTFGQYYGIILSSEQHNQFYIPPGFAHGFVVLSEFAIFSYKCTDYYHPEDEGGILWDDLDLAIPWPITDVQVSAKDAQLPYFRNINLK